MMIFFPQIFSYPDGLANDLKQHRSLVSDPKTIDIYEQYVGQWVDLVESTIFNKTDERCVSFIEKCVNKN